MSNLTMAITNKNLIIKEKKLYGIKLAAVKSFIGKNRAPRVQVEYDVELYGAEKKS